MIVTEPPHVLLASGPRSGPRSARPALIRKRELTRFLALAIDAAGLQGNVSVLLTDDETMRGLNRQFRKKNRPTDVLSFPPLEPGTTPERTRKKHAGDLAISITTAARQASAFDHPLEVEVKILLLHGVLHLAGLDHEADSGDMARRENALRKKFGLPTGLISRSARSRGLVKKKPVRASARRGAQP